MMIILTQVPLLLQLLLQVSNLRMVRYHLLFSEHQGSLSKLQELSLIKQRRLELSPVIDTRQHHYYQQ